MEILRWDESSDQVLGELGIKYQAFPKAAAKVNLLQQQLQPWLPSMQ